MPEGYSFVELFLVLSGPLRKPGLLTSDEHREILFVGGRLSPLLEVPGLFTHFLCALLAGFLGETFLSPPIHRFNSTQAIQTNDSSVSGPSLRRESRLESSMNSVEASDRSALSSSALDMIPYYPRPSRQRCSGTVQPGFTGPSPGDA